MTVPTITKGSLLFLLPEDTTAGVEIGFYARVTSVRGDNVTSVAVEAAGPTGRFVVDRSTANQRVVPAGEITGSRAHTWLRLGVACVVEPDVVFGQVVGVKGDDVEVATAQGSEWVSVGALRATVHPFTAMLLFDEQWPMRNWTVQVVSRVDDVVREMMQGNRDDQVPTIPAILAAMDVPIRVKGDLRRRWIEQESGVERTTTLDHALKYSFYYGSNRVAPYRVRRELGASICADPSVGSSTPAGSKTTGKGKNKRVRSSAFFEDTSEEDEYHSDSADETKASGTPRRVIRDRHSWAADDNRSKRQRTPRSAAVPKDTQQIIDVDEAIPSQERSQVVPLVSDEAQLVMHLAKDPVALQLYLQCRQAPTVNRPAPAPAAPSASRNRYAFSPSDVQVAIHNAITHPDHLGTSPSTFVQRLISSPAVTFDRHPGVLMRLYDFGFGPPGLSVMHFGTVTLLERMQRQRERSVNLEDFSGAVRVPAPVVPTTWRQLQNGVNGLGVYCNVFCEPVTARFVSAISTFLSEIEAFGDWSERHLGDLEFWINEQLFEYRRLADHDAHNKTNTRESALGWLSPSNPSLIRLGAVLLRQDVEAKRVKEVKLDGEHREKAPTRPAGSAGPVKRKIPQKVLDEMPKKDGKELCMKYASKRGCHGGTDEHCAFGDRAHFIAPIMPPVVREYLVTKMGGIADVYQRR